MDEKWKVMGSGEWAVFYCHIAPPAGEGGAAGTKGGEGGAKGGKEPLSVPSCQSLSEKV